MQRKPVNRLPVVVCASIMLFLGTSYNTIVIDGTKDFSTDEAVAGTSGSTWYFTWDANAVYLGAENSDVAVNASSKWLLWYIDTDPRSIPGQGTGTVTGQTYNTQRPTLPFTANYHFRWKADDSYINLQTFNGSSWTSGDQTGIQHSRSGNYVEFKIPRSSLGSPDQVYICAAMINEAAGSEWTYFIVPALQGDSYNPALSHYLGFTLDSGRSPNDAAYADNPLPVQLMSFRCSALAGGNVALAWSTASEVKNYGFEVQRAVQGSNAFAALPDGFVPGHGTTVDRHDYAYVDRTAGNGRWSYRLKQLDLDGSVHFSDAIDVSVATTAAPADQPGRIGLLQNYPNPFNPTTLIRYTIHDRQSTSLKVYDMLGREVAVLESGMREAGLHEVRFDGGNHPSGIYYFRLQSGTFTETKKALLLR